MKKPYYCMWTLFVLGLFLFSEASLAQGKIVGHVKDKKTGEVLIGVNIVILQTSIGVASDIEGEYSLINVPVGTYSVQASSVGFKKVTQTNVIVSKGQTTRLDFELEQAVIEMEAVVVVAERNILHKEISSSQTVFTADQIKETAGINTVQEYLSLQAGITGSTYLNIRGGSARETGTLINGVAFVNSRVGSAESFIPSSSIEQVSLRSGGMTAEYGEFRSGVIDLTAKVGSHTGYHGSFSIKKNQAQLKRFGPSLFDPMNNILRPHLDPDIAFIGVSEAAKKGIISPYEQQQFFYNQSFSGHKYYSTALPTTWQTSIKNKGYDPKTALSAVDLYLIDAWMHTVMPDFDKLNSVIDKLNGQGLAIGNKVTDQNLINLFKNHSLKEGREYDYNFDGGFGGPIPFFSEVLGGMTFYLSNVTARTSFIQPKVQDSDINSTTMLVLNTNVTNSMQLKITGIYNRHNGVSPTRGGDSEVPAIYAGQNLLNAAGVPNGHERGSFLGEDNIQPFVSSGAFGPQYWYYLTDSQNWIQTNYLISANLTHAISPTTFYDATVSYQRTMDDINAIDNRNDEVLYRLGMGGVLPLTEMPYGRRILPINTAVDTVDGFIFDQFYTLPGLGQRFGGKGGCLYDKSTNEQFRAKINFGTQLNKSNLVKTGVELMYMNLDNARYGYWSDIGSAYEYMFKVQPITLSAYIQDEITHEEMVLNVGLRADYYGEVSGLQWPTGRPWDTPALGTPTTDYPNWLPILQAGRSNIWEKWDSLNTAYVAAGETPLYQTVKSHFTLSPRLGLSFPISERTKFYFNYGHFYALPSYSELYFYNVRLGSAKGGLYNFGNPNLKPARTIQYELGIDYNLLDAYLIHVAGYYKDITDEVDVINFRPNINVNYTFRTNGAYRDIKGLEVQITKSVGDIFTGWIKGQYVYASSGRSGRINVYENPVTNANTELTYFYGDPSRPDPVPQVAANFTVKSPADWGYFLGEWRLSVLPDWKQGQIFRYNPRGLDVNNEFRWPSLWLVNLGLSKTVDLKYANATFSLNVRNLLNAKVFTYNYAFAAGLGSATSPSPDFRSYMSSLHLSQYIDTYYDPLRQEKGVNGKTEDAYLYPGYVRQDGTVVNENKVGDFRSANNPVINDPNYDVFVYSNPRSLWFGVTIDF